VGHVDLIPHTTDTAGDDFVGVSTRKYLNEANQQSGPLGDFFGNRPRESYGEKVVRSERTEMAELLRLANSLAVTRLVWLSMSCSMLCLTYKNSSKRVQIVDMAFGFLTRKRS